ncbi:hypothetical protein H4R33_002228 [Dimargaris cristalligena]|uniref:Alpha/Beta hydrolase protein n=1 Tax=Dimargaris cristalligena TaxID=215637 RepID=A0A4Q0A0Z8_9FUNG|nr:hypothetical protein H4R33_002228 [Dimargaris cristalligena]RKP39776.1 Alpha/Beta hydrolase protein [Dimargaris cristalligena]|eukprot:RKP39776.1 Alpha/Beta hydrolase protein [Dimargaris cristalligena]
MPLLARLLQTTWFIGCDIWLGLTLILHCAGTIWSYFTCGPRRPTWDLKVALIHTFIHHSFTSSLKVGIHYARRNQRDLAVSPRVGINYPINPWTLEESEVRAIPGLVKALEPISQLLRPTTTNSFKKASSAPTNVAFEDHILPAEWVVHREVQGRMAARMTTHKHQSNANSLGHLGPLFPAEPIMLYLHGGGFVMGGFGGHRPLICELSKQIGRHIFTIDYRLAPEHRFPCALVDVIYTYLKLVATPTQGGLGFNADRIILAGDSAGGTLIVTTMLFLRDHNLPLPQGVILLSPWLDLTCTTPSWTQHIPFDFLGPVFITDPLFNPALSYASPDASYVGHLPYITHPYVSPLTPMPTTTTTTPTDPPTSFHNLPPILIQGDEPNKWQTISYGSPIA